MIVKVDTQAVRDASAEIARQNQSIRSDFRKVETAISRLDRAWSGTASVQGINKLQHIKKSFTEQRYQVVDDLVRFIRLQVGENYESAEQTNVKSASAFK